MIIDINFLDFISQEEVRLFQESLFELAGIVSEITDTRGNRLCGCVADNPFCVLMREQSETAAICAKRNEALDLESLNETSPFLQRCENLGLISASLPVMIKGTHVANLKLGRVRTTDMPEDAMYEFAASHGFPPGKLAEAYTGTPVLTAAEFSNAVKFIKLSVQTLSEKAYQAHLLEKGHEERNRMLTAMNTVMDHVNALVYVTAPRTYTIEYANSYACKAAGNENLEGMTCYTAIQNRESPCPFCPYPEIFDGAGASTGKTLYSEHHNAKLKRDYTITDKAIQWYDGRILHMRVAADITDRNELLAARAGVAAQREFFSRMSHELRTPMNGILGLTELALRAAPPLKVEEYLKKIKTSAIALGNTLNDILDVSRIEAGGLNLEHAVFNIHDTIVGATESILPGAKAKGLGFIVSIDDSVPTHAVGDAARISQILSNLVDNAVKFTSDGLVAITVEASKPLPGKIRLQCSVKDSGVGIEQGRIEEMFAPFAQADVSLTREFGGTGLGLAIVKMLVDLMGGEIAASSTPGKGSTFSFSVLLGSADPKGSELAPGMRNKKTLLDNPSP